MSDLDSDVSAEFAQRRDSAEAKLVEHSLPKSLDLSRLSQLRFSETTFPDTVDRTIRALKQNRVVLLIEGSSGDSAKLVDQIVAHGLKREFVMDLAQSDKQEIQLQCNRALNMSVPLHVSGRVDHCEESFEQALNDLESVHDLMTAQIGGGTGGFYHIISSLIIGGQAQAALSQQLVAKVKNWSPEELGAACSLANRMDQLIALQKKFASSLLSSAQISSKDNSSFETISNLASELGQGLSGLIDDVKLIHEQIGIKCDGKLVDSRKALEAMQFIDQFYSCNGQFIANVSFDDEFWTHINELERCIDSGRRCLQILDRHRGYVKSDTWNNPGLERLLESYKSYVNGVWFSQLFNRSGQRASDQVVDLFTSTNVVPDSPAQVVKILEELIEAQNLRRSIKGFSAAWERIVGINLNPTDSLKKTSWDRLANVVRFVSIFRNRYLGLEAFEQLVKIAKAPQGLYLKSPLVRDALDKVNKVEGQLQRLCALLRIEPQLAENIVSSSDLTELGAWINELPASKKEFETVIDLNQTKLDARERGFGVVVEAAQGDTGSSTAECLAASWAQGAFSDAELEHGMTMKLGRAELDRQRRRIRDRKLVHNHLELASISFNCWAKLQPIRAGEAGSGEDLSSLPLLLSYFPVIRCGSEVPAELLQGFDDSKGKVPLLVLVGADEAKIGRLKDAPTNVEILNCKDLEDLSDSISNAGRCILPKVVDARTAITADADPVMHKIYEYLISRGHQVDVFMPNQSGGIELGLRNPAKPDQYLLGFVGDGAYWQSISDTIEREVTIPEIWRKAGWNIHRIYSIEFLRNQELELAIIDDAIRRARVRDLTGT